MVGGAFVIGSGAGSMRRLAHFSVDQEKLKQKQSQPATLEASLYCPTSSVSYTLCLEGSPSFPISPPSGDPELKYTSLGETIHIQI